MGVLNDGDLAVGVGDDAGVDPILPIAVGKAGCAGDKVKIAQSLGVVIAGEEAQPSVGELHRHRLGVPLIGGGAGIVLAPRPVHTVLRVEKADVLGLRAAGVLKGVAGEHDLPPAGDKALGGGHQISPLAVLLQGEQGGDAPALAAVSGGHKIEEAGALDLEGSVLEEEVAVDRLAIVGSGHIEMLVHREPLHRGIAGDRLDGIAIQVVIVGISLIITLYLIAVRVGGEEEPSLAVKAGLLGGPQITAAVEGHTVGVEIGQQIDGLLTAFIFHRHRGVDEAGGTVSAVLIAVVP
ncbi:Uncharacterised protein [Flavonifractor plautii]|uniref:Uncharacterized protein n=1 Tax=Flavonifractor plautii TaxID=292800 RepID=A0A174BWY9_FLAPL|nr:Uncharacterised protein [Flavonifractor plautii]